MGAIIDVHMNITIIIFNFRYKREPGMVFDGPPKIFKAPPNIEEELNRECTNNINVVRAEIPHLQDQINNMTTYSQRQMDEARDALKKVESQEKEVEQLR